MGKEGPVLEESAGDSVGVALGEAGFEVRGEVWTDYN